MSRSINCSKCGSKMHQADQGVDQYEPDIVIPSEAAKKTTIDECGDDVLVSFTLEKIGFHFIKVIRLMKTEFGQTLENLMDGYYSERIPLKRAKELKQKFEALGAVVNIGVK